MKKISLIISCFHLFFIIGYATISYAQPYTRNAAKDTAAENIPFDGYGSPNREITALGIDYLNGDSVPKDEKKGITILRKAVADGYAHAQWYLGELYIKGDSGLPQDTNYGFELLRKSASQGHNGAQLSLLQYYLDNVKIANNKSSRIQKLIQLAENGDSNAQCALGSIYSNGLYGISKNIDEARKWWKKSAAQNNKVAISGLEFMDKK